MPLDALERDIASIGAGLARRLARWLALIAEFDRRGAARRWGFRGTAEWLAWRCEIDRRTARSHVHVARRLAELPEVRAAFTAGELSYSKVRAITRAHPGEDEQALLAMARAMTADRLERSVRGLRTAPSADLETANRVHEERFVEWHWEDDGALRLNGRLAPDDGAAVVEALETAAETLHAPVPGATPEAPRWRPPLGARRADALAELVHSGCPRTQVVLHVDAEALACTAEAAEERRGELCALRDGPALPSETARRLSCDADISGSAGARADLGRARRTVSPALRGALERRDGCCRFPACDRRHGLHAHHVTHWAHGGPTDRDNLVLLCRFHHRLVHEDGFRVEAAGGRFRFRRPDGRELEDRPPPMAAAA